MPDFGPNGEYILLPVDIPVPNVVNENFVSKTVRKTHIVNDAVHFGGLISGPTRGINIVPRFGELEGLALGKGPIGRRDDIGNPGPSQILNSPGFRVLTLIPVLPGGVTIDINVRYWPDTEADRPSLLIKASDELGIPEDVEVIAPGGGDLGFVTISVHLFIPIIGVLECYRKGRSPRFDAYTFWDNLVVS